jgi:hypothetical protein
MTSQSSPELPGLAWTEGHTLTAKSGTKLRRWGSVQQACKILDDCDREIIYDLIRVDSIRGYKRRPHASNSHWRIDLLSVWEHKQRQLGSGRGA